ncbi:MAG: homoserine dehydrogenase [Anaerolineales bacterium]
MKHQKIALLGFGNVGQAFARLLQRKRDLLLQDYGLEFYLTAIATAQHGMAIDPRGIEIERALQVISASGNLNELSTIKLSDDPFKFIRLCEADVLFENTPVNYENGQPAVSFLHTAMEMGMHVITANKGPVVHAYQQLTDLAAKHGRKFYFESAVMDGAPIFSLFRQSLPAVNLHGFTGILNSTTNLILARMETGETMPEAIAYAQSIGIAETDPSGDVDGWDAAVKVAALVTVLMGTPLKPSQVHRTGIRHLSSMDIDQARQQGLRWKLVCTARREAGQVVARVSPQLVTPDSPLYGVNGTSSIVNFETDVLPQLSIIEGNPGPETTAYGLLADFINLYK